jgi:hypothetical protein
MAKKNFSTGVENLFEHHAKNVESEPLEVVDKKEKAVEDTRTPPETPVQASKPVAVESNTTPAKETAKPMKKRTTPVKKAETVKQIEYVAREEVPETFINRTYSISRQVINAITDYSYHNKTDKNSIVNAALKAYLGEYYDNAEK